MTSGFLRPQSTAATRKSRCHGPEPVRRANPVQGTLPSVPDVWVVRPNQPAFPEAEKSTSRNDHVIDYIDAEQSGRLDHPPGEGKVFGARSHVAGRVVMGENNRARPCHYGRPEHLPGRHAEMGDSACRHQL